MTYQRPNPKRMTIFHSAMHLSYIASYYPDVRVNAKAELVTLAPVGENNISLTSKSHDSVFLAHA